MKATRTTQKIKSVFFTISASLILMGCGSFQGSSYYDLDGIYNSKSQVRMERPQKINSTKSSYYKEYFKEAAEGSLSENEMYFTDTDSYSSEGEYMDSSSYTESSQIPWGERTNRTEVVIIDRTPNYFWGLSSFAFRSSPFWINYYYNDPFAFGYYPSPFAFSRFDPYYYGGFSRGWGYGSFYSPYSYYPGFNYGYNWNRWNRWNRHPGIYNNGYVGNRHYNSDYNQTVARIKSGRGEKNYNDSSRTSNTKDRNAKTNESITVNNTINRINRGRGFNSLGNTYIINNDRNTTLNTKSSVNSRTPRPVYGNSLNSSIYGSTNTSPNKSVQTNTQGRFIQSRSRLGERNSTNTTQPVRVRRSTPAYPSSGSTTRSYNNTQRTYSQPSRNFNSSPSRSYNSGNRSSSGSSGSSSGRGSSGRRN